MMVKDTVLPMTTAGLVQAIADNQSRVMFRNRGVQEELKQLLVDDANGFAHLVLHNSAPIYADELMGAPTL
jgi:hypothetical protein